MSSMTMPTPNMSNETVTQNEYEYDYDYEDEDKQQSTNILINNQDSTGKYIYMIFHIMMAFIAIFLSWRCNNGNFDILSFLIALLFPYVYIIYILATKGTCDRI